MTISSPSSICLLVFVLFTVSSFCHLPSQLNADHSFSQTYCNAVPYLRSTFPEFVKAKTPANPIPPDPMAPDPATRPFQNDMPTYDFHDTMASIWQSHPTKLQDIHQAVYSAGFEGLKELTQKEKDNALAILGNGGEWSI